MGSRGELEGRGRRPGPFAFRLFLTIGWLAVIATAFGLGYLLADHDATQAALRIQALQTERDALSEALASAKEANVRLERSHVIDSEAKRAAQAQLGELQGERLRLAKRVAYLQGLMRNGQTGVVEVKEFLLTEGDQPGLFDYRFTVNQLVPDFRRSQGTAVVKVVLRRDGKRVTLSLSELPGSTSGRHPMAFDFFQTFEGRIQLPPDVEPVEVVVDIEPGNNNLMESSEAFAWHAEIGGAISLLPSGGDEAADKDQVFGLGGEPGKTIPASMNHIEH
jgi:hypothetical protein